MNIKVCSVAAVALNNVIGNENSLPWRLPSDLKWFKQLTKNHVIIMGRKTWDSLPKKPLPNRYNIVISSQFDNTHPDDKTFLTNDPKHALSVGMFEARRRGQDKIFVIGGESIYNTYFELIDEHYITSVIARPEGDSKYPQINFSKFESHVLLDAPFPSDEDEFVFTIFHYVRKAA